jgi:triosephosphate isomerase
MGKRNKLVVGNWKMNGSRASIATLLDGLRSAGPVPAQTVVCPPFPYLADVAVSLAGTHIAWGGQDCAPQDSGAFTGDVSPAMLADLGCRWVIVGHSERRHGHAEGDKLVAEKAKAALGHNLTPIVCVGETLAERDAGQTDAVVKRQLSAVIHHLAHCVPQIVVAYEPVWAIGTGRTATPEQAQAVHALLRAQLHAATESSDRMCILYGGSVKPDNAAALFSQPDIDGGLIGGAALKADDFIAICRAAG